MLRDTLNNPITNLNNPIKNKKMKFEEKIAKLLSIAGIKINGNNPWDIQIHNPKLYSRVLSGGTLALGEAYMGGWWDCRKLDEFFNRVLKAELDDEIKSRFIWDVIKAKIMNLQSKSRAFEVGERHYDLDNELYRLMLDKRMIYSCGYWKNAKNLDQAQEAKLDLSCKKLNLKPGMRVLDIGCGWGGFAKYAAKKYKVKVVGITVSKEQAKLAQESCKGLPVEIRVQDYRDLNEKFDSIISIGMFEHVGPKNYKEFMRIVHRCLKPSGLFLLHTIGNNKSYASPEPWMEKYIFPNHLVPSAKQITTAAEGLFVLEDWHNFGMDYDKTLLAWHANFIKNWPKLKGRYNERFFRMWTYYLLSCAGGFRARHNQLWQIVFSKEYKEEYRSIR
jgi:cyclopropane-fatty-acyl-phospholipid synthase